MILDGHGRLQTWYISSNVEVATNFHSSTVYLTILSRCGPDGHSHIQLFNIIHLYPQERSRYFYTRKIPLGRRRYFINALDLMRFIYSACRLVLVF
jgi:hypothetical protein